MKVSRLSLMTRQGYEAPKVALIAVETQGVLCGSGGNATVTNTNGGTEYINLTDVSW